MRSTAPPARAGNHIGAAGLGGKAAQEQQARQRCGHRAADEVAGRRRRGNDQRNHRAGRKTGGGCERGLQGLRSRIGRQPEFVARVSPKASCAINCSATCFASAGSSPRRT